MSISQSVLSNNCNHYDKADHINLVHRFRTGQDCC